ncbi:MAG: hypothetical protein NVS2B12_35220 [Ktedonobacteraceae bacterium]
MHPSLQLEVQKQGQAASFCTPISLSFSVIQIIKQVHLLPP